MMYRSLAVAALSLALTSVASAQSIYVAPGGVANVYVTPNGLYDPYAAPTAVLGPGYYGNGYLNGGGYGIPPVAAPVPTFDAGYPTAPIIDEPLSAYGSAPGVYMQRRVYRTPDVLPPRPPLPIPIIGGLFR
jgi:hypothetical protein